MNNINTIITEKPGISTKIARAISPDSFDERGRCKNLEKDIITLRPDNYDYNSQTLGIQESKKFYLTKKGFPREYSMQIEHISEQGENHARAVKSRIKRQNELLKQRGQKQIIAEEINYYDLVKENERYIICDSSGSPYNFNFKGKSLMDFVLNSEKWKDLESNLWLTGSAKTKRNESYLARNRFFNQILAFQTLPNGEEIELDKIIAATDMDIAGAHIFHSVVEGAKYVAKKYNKNKTIKEDQIYRMNLSSLEPNKVLEELENLNRFDWGNAYAGKSRQIFDFLYGVSVTSEFNHQKNKILKNSNQSNTKNSIKKRKFSVGRNVILGLESLLDLENQISEKEEKETYIIFEGYPDNNEIKERIKKGDYVSAKIAKKRTGVGQANFIGNLRERNIGTHTTRYTLPTRFEKLGLAQIKGKRIESTDFGQEYYSELEKILNSDERDFSLKKANKFLSDTMDYLKELDKQNISSNEIESRFNGYVSTILPSLKKHFSEVSSESEEIIYNLVQKMNNNQSQEKGPSNNSSRTNSDSQDMRKLIGNDKVVPVEMINKIIDPQTNEPISSATVERYSIREKSEESNKLGNICCIESDYEFRLHRGKDIESIEKSDSEDYTVFKAPGWIDINKRVRSLEEMDLEMPYREGESAHEPLDIEDPSFGMINGRKGFLLAKEYERPWDLTGEKNAIINNGGFNVQSFKIKNNEFNRVERYNYFYAHNFESVLSAMLEKYGIQFRETAKLMEEMYLHSE